MDSNETLIDYLKNIENKTLLEIESGNDAITFYRAYDRTNKQDVFIKEFDLKMDKLNEYQAEITAYENVYVNNMIRPIIFGIIIDDQKIKKYGIIIFPYIKIGDLYSIMSDKSWVFNEQVLESFAFNLILFLYSIHSKGLIHRDIKLNNILLEIADIQSFTFTFSPNNFLVTDFGSSLYANGDNVNYTKKFRGTYQYLPPEYFNSHGKIITEKMDIFACGVLLYAIIVGDYPEFDYIIKRNGKIVGFNTDVNIENFFYLDPFDRVSDEMKEIIKSMLTYDHLQRPDAKSLLKNDLFANLLHPKDISTSDDEII